MESEFGKNAWLYDRYTRVLRNERERAFWRRLLSETGGRSVLDVGAGTGFLSRIALEQGFEVTALDASSGMLEQAVKNFGCYKERFTAHIGDAQELPFPDASFDVVMTRAALWTLPEPAKMIQGAARVLKPGGVFLLSDGVFKHLHTPVVFFSAVCHAITDFLLGGKLPNFRRTGETRADFSPFPLEKVIAELKQIGAKKISHYDLVPYQDFLYRLIGLYWYPYLLHVRF